MNEVTHPITVLFPISAKLNGFRPCRCQEHIPARRCSLVQRQVVAHHFQVVAHHLLEADMYDAAVRQLSSWVSRISSFS